MKKLVIQEIKNKKGQTYKLKIEEQTSHGTNFAKNSTVFRYRKFSIESSQYYGGPFCNEDKLRVMPRWITNKTKNTISNFYFDEEWLKKMRSAVKEYNKRFCNCNDCVDRHCNYCLIGK